MAFANLSKMYGSPSPNLRPRMMVNDVLILTCQRYINGASHMCNYLLSQLFCYFGLWGSTVTTRFIPRRFTLLLGHVKNPWRNNSWRPFLATRSPSPVSLYCVQHSIRTTRPVYIGIQDRVVYSHSFRILSDQLK